LKGKPDWNGPLAWSNCGNHVEQLANNFASAVVLPYGCPGVWYWSAGSVSVDTITSPKVEMFSWGAILFS
jgi:uncharacterized membrane-anchored protein